MQKRFNFSIINKISSSYKTCCTSMKEFVLENINCLILLNDEENKIEN
jgi:hypothetical protein